MDSELACKLHELKAGRGSCWFVSNTCPKCGGRMVSNGYFVWCMSSAAQCGYDAPVPAETEAQG